MRQPGRLRISWQDDNTLKLEFDAGTQTRLLNFDRAKQPPAEKTWQGFSRADWEGPGVGRGRRAGRTDNARDRRRPARRAGVPAAAVRDCVAVRRHAAGARSTAAAISRS